MSFYGRIIDMLRGIRASVSTSFISGYTRTYPFLTIQSGSYRNWKTDQHPTILCLGSYQGRTPLTASKNYTHGIQLHSIDPYDCAWLLKTIYMMKRGGQIITPIYFYRYIKNARPNIIKKGYRIYHTELCDFKMISPGASSQSVEASYPVSDGRDLNIKQLNSMIQNSYNTIKENYTNPSPVAYNTSELQAHIAEAINQKKIFF